MWAKNQPDINNNIGSESCGTLFNPLTGFTGLNDMICENIRPVMCEFSCEISFILICLHFLFCQHLYVLMNARLECLCLRVKPAPFVLLDCSALGTRLLVNLVCQASTPAIMDKAPVTAAPKGSMDLINHKHFACNVTRIAGKMLQVKLAARNATPI
jgi:hypothetical protein